MAGLMSKRQQARNEKVLQDLVHNVPGNNFCADCQARNPGTCALLPLVLLIVDGHTCERLRSRVIVSCRAVLCRVVPCRIVDAASISDHIR